jgi:hypothetical protein
LRGRGRIVGAAGELGIRRSFRPSLPLHVIGGQPDSLRPRRESVQIAVPADVLDRRPALSERGANGAKTLPGEGHSNDTPIRLVVRHLTVQGRIT